MKLLALPLFVAGVLFAGVVATAGGAQTAETTTETVQHTTTQTVTQPTTTSVVETTTVQETTTAEATTAEATTVLTTTVAPTTTSPTTTSSSEGTNNGTPTWVWVLLALLAAAVIGLAVLLLSRRGTAALPDSERRQRLHVAIASWAAQGWALQSETTDTAVLQRGDEQMMVTVDPAGQIVTRPVTPQPPSWPGTT